MVWELFPVKRVFKLGYDRSVCAHDWNNAGNSFTTKAEHYHMTLAAECDIKSKSVQICSSHKNGETYSG